MLLGTIGASFLGNLQTGKGTIMASGSREKIRARHDFWYKSIIKTNLDLMMFIEEIIYLKYNMGHML